MTKQVAESKGLITFLAKLFLLEETQVVQALVSRHVHSWGEFKARIALEAQVIEEKEESK